MEIQSPPPLDEMDFVNGWLTNYFDIKLIFICFNITWISKLEVEESQVILLLVLVFIEKGIYLAI